MSRYPEECKNVCSQTLRRVVTCRNALTQDLVREELCGSRKPDAELKCPACAAWRLRPITGECEPDPRYPQCDEQHPGRRRNEWVCETGPGQCEVIDLPPAPDDPCVCD